MNILILGGGGREHALAWAIRQNPKCDRLIVAPGNAGIANVAECADLNILSRAEVLEFAQENAIDFVVIGPEAPLAAGVSDALRDAGFLVFGPSQAAAKLEASKAFTKEICDACGAPTAAWARFTDAASARDYVSAQGAPIVVKADGLAAGKGVTVAETVDQAHDAIDAIFDGEFGKMSVVIEEFMEGEEASFFILCDGTDCLPVGTAQDHKRAYDNDEGPNTGGMGAYAPLPWLPEDGVQTIVDEIAHPVAAEMVRRGTPYQGLLYIGAAWGPEGPAVVEFNARFGDPETQAVLSLLETPLADVLLAVAEGRLGEVGPLEWKDGYAALVVLAAEGYPQAAKTGGVITGDALDDASKVLHAGTALEGGLEGGNYLASGGRVLGAVGHGATLEEAVADAYEVIGGIELPGSFYRKDIARPAIEGAISL